jgi:hypothetical protein
MDTAPLICLTIELVVIGAFHDVAGKDGSVREEPSGDQNRMRQPPLLFYKTPISR